MLASVDTSRPRWWMAFYFSESLINGNQEHLFNNKRESPVA